MPESGGWGLGSGPELGEALVVRQTADGSFSLWSPAFREGFHSGRGALREARETFVAPAQLERFPPGSTLQVVDVAVGTGSNTAALLEACRARGLRLRWWGLECDPRPLQLALAAAGFGRQWSAEALEPLHQLAATGRWQGPLGSGRLLWGDARHRVKELLAPARGGCDLLLHDAFSPRRCPQLWTLEFLGDLAGLLAPSGRLLTYCSAAAVRGALRQLGLQLAAIPAAAAHQGSQGEERLAAQRPRLAWSGGTVASPRPFQSDPLQSDPLKPDPLQPGSLKTGPLEPAAAWRPLTPMEEDHLTTTAAVPYRDPSGRASAEAILAERSRCQAEQLAAGRVLASSAWRRRWGLEMRQPT